MEQSSSCICLLDVTLLESITSGCFVKASYVRAAHERAATQEAGAWQLVREAKEDLENRNRALESARQEQEVSCGEP